MKVVVFVRNSADPNVLDAPYMQRIMSWLTGLPAKGVGLAQNIEQIPADMNAKHILGWCTRYCDVLRNPANTGADSDQFALEIDATIQALWQAKKDTLGAAKRTWIQTYVIGALVDESTIAAWLTPDGFDTSEDIEPTATL